MDKVTTTENDPAAKKKWDAPELTTHGGFLEVTQFSSGTGPDDGFFDPGAASSAA
jgi:hypothetical protein